MSYHQHLNCYKIRAKKFVRVLDKGRTLSKMYGRETGNARSDRKGQIKCTVGNREKLNKTVRQRSRVWPGKSARSKTRKFKIGPKLCKNTSLRKINKPLIV